MLELTGISKGFGANGVVNDLNLTVYKGEFFSLLGPSGCGKTTILRMIAGIVSPDAGTVSIEGQDVTQAAINERDITLVFQNYALFPHMSVFDNVAFGLRMQRLRKVEIQQRVAQALELVQLHGKESRKPSQLSGGQQQRVALARALVVRPRLLLLDEPLSNLDASLRDQMRWQLKEIQQKVGVTMVLVTHDIQEAFALSKRLAIMNSGRIEQIGTPQEIYGRPANPFVASFTGEANLLDGIVEDDGNGGYAVRLDEDLRIGVDASGRQLEIGKKITVLIRPELIIVNPHASAKSEGERCRNDNVFLATVSEVMYLGPQARVTLKIGNISLIGSVLSNTIDADMRQQNISIPRTACVPFG